MLQKLALYHNPIGDDGIQSLASAWVINKNLEILDVSDCNISIKPQVLVIFSIGMRLVWIISGHVTQRIL